MEYNYKTAFKNTGRGMAQLGCCIVHTICTHKALTALTISMVANIYLFATVAAQRIEGDAISKRMFEIEHENDYLKGSNVKYYSYDESLFK